MTENAPKRDGLFYFIALLCGIGAGVVQVTIQDPLMTALVVLASTMVLGYLRDARPWRWTLLVGLCVPVVMIVTKLLNYYQALTRAGIAGSILIILPGVAGAYGGYFGRKFIRVMFQGEQH